MKLPWPLHVIDFEASSLEPSGYPIEVGLATCTGAERPVQVWSSLIIPTPDWSAHGHWSVASAKIHGLRGRDLAAGLSPLQVATALNAAIGMNGIAWCDGGPYDAQWAQKLYRAAGIAPVFVLADWHRLILTLGKRAASRATAWLDRTPAVHRAGPDAEQLLRAIVHP